MAVCSSSGSSPSLSDRRSFFNVSCKVKSLELPRAEEFAKLDQKGFQGDSAFFASLLKGCARSQDIKRGRKVHAQIAAEERHHQSLYLSNLVIDMYGKCGELSEAFAVFSSLENPNVFSWNIMMSAFAQNGDLLTAKKLFDSMPVKDVVSWNTMLAAFAQNDRLDQAQRLFSQMRGRNATTWCVMITAYAQKGRVRDSKALFDKMPSKNLFSWTAMVAAYAQNGLLQEAKELFLKMPQRCSVSWNTLITAYSRNGEMLEARRLFEEMPQRDVVAWSSIVAGYGQNGEGDEAILFFRMMDLEGIRANEVTFVSCLDACATVSALALGRVLHDDILEGSSCRWNVLVGNSLVNMYGKCGSLSDAKRVFDLMPVTDVVSWTALIAVHAQNGFGSAAVEFFQGMMQLGLQPDEISFVGVLYACNHAGLLDLGCSCFVGIQQDYGVAPRVDHYVCVLDILGRTGKLQEMEEVIRFMPFQPNLLAWNTLLSACRVHKDVERGKRAAQRVFELDSEEVGPYVVLSNIHASVNDAAEAAKVRKVLQERNMKKIPGFSWIQVKGKVHEFVAGDQRHPRREEIYAAVDRLLAESKKVGYVPDAETSLLLDAKQEGAACDYHSEKLAIAFGILSTPPGMPLRIVKNLRVCSDCHAATKFISRVTGREILVRDGNRFHRFEGGKCSCGDFW